MKRVKWHSVCNAQGLTIAIPRTKRMYKGALVVRHFVCGVWMMVFGHFDSKEKEVLAEIHCAECSEFYCAGCDVQCHRNPKLRSHTRKKAEEAEEIVVSITKNAPKPPPPPPATKQANPSESKSTKSPSTSGNSKEEDAGKQEKTPDALEQVAFLIDETSIDIHTKVLLARAATGAVPQPKTEPQVSNGLQQFYDEMEQKEVG